MAGSNDFTGQNIQDTYQRVLQLSSSGELADGTGSLVPLLTITASHAISASHEITFELFSSHAQTASTASFANNFTASGNISASGIGFFSQISVDGQSALDTLDTTGRVFGDSDITKIEIGKTATTTSTVIEGNITASGDISSSGTGSFSDGRFSGKVGIGITSPAEKLHVIGNIRIDDTAGNGSNLQFRINGTPNSIFSNTFNLAGGSTSKTDFNAYVYNNNPFGIWTNNIRRLVVQGDGNISASGNFIGLTGSFGKLETSNIKLGGTEITSTAAEINFLDGVISNVKEAYDTVSYNGTTGVLTLTELDNGTDTVDLGVGSTDTPTFAGLTITKVDKGGLGTYGDVLESVGQSTTFTITGIPTIPGRASNKVSKPSPTFIRNNVVNSDSIILVTCTTAELSAVGFGNDTPTAVENSGFFLNIGNESGADFTTTSASFSAIIL